MRINEVNSKKELRTMRKQYSPLEAAKHQQAVKRDNRSHEKTNQSGYTLAEMLVSVGAIIVMSIMGIIGFGAVRDGNGMSFLIGSGVVIGGLVFLAGAVYVVFRVGIPALAEIREKKEKSII